jgi:ribokinase
MLAAADWVCPNETELAKLANEGRPTSTLDEVVLAAKRLRRRGARNVLVTRGSKGALALTEDAPAVSGKSRGSARRLVRLTT